MREIDPVLRAALSRRHTQVFSMASLDFESGPVYVHNSTGDFEWNGVTWQGLGWIGSVSDVVEDAELRPGNLSLDLNRLNSGLINLARTEHHRGRSAKIYIASRSLVDGGLEGEPLLVPEGTMDVMSSSMGSGDATLQLTVTDSRAIMLRSPNIFISNQQQQQRHPGDKACSLQSELNNLVLNWGPGGGRVTASYTPGFGGRFGSSRCHEADPKGGGDGAARAA